MTPHHEKGSEGDTFAEGVLEKQTRLASQMRGDYDFIVCGAGASGSVVAGRLAANPAVNVLLLEAGGGDDTAMVADPSRWLSTLGSDLDCCFMTEPNPSAHQRSMLYSLGKVLGGGASINVATWSRGHQSDWDHYCEVAGDPGWSYRFVLELYRRIENCHGRADPEYQGASGPMRVQPAPTPHPFFTAMLEAAETHGIRRFASANGQMA